MKRVKNRVIFLSLLGLFQSTFLFGQNQLNVSAGVGSVRGDFLSDFLAIEGIGPHAQAAYFFKAKNNHFSFGPIASFTQNAQSRTLSYDSLPRVSNMNIQHYFLGVQLKTYLASSAWIYNPYPGRVLPFLSIGTGAVFSSTTMSGSLPPQGFTVQEGFNTSAAANVELGLEVNLTQTLSLKGGFTMRGGMNDFWDGLAGTGNAKDILVSTQIGVVYNFIKDQVF